MTTMATRWRTELAVVALAALTALPLSVAAIGLAPGVASADCGGIGPVLSRVADARGTTFVGRFIGGEVLDRGVRLEWDVEEVHAGDVAPGALAFHSHPCDWMFLEPGARYLFSTGARIPRRRATYADTLAWRLDGDTATLAAFQDQGDPPHLFTDPGEYPAAARDATTLDAALALVVPGHVPAPSPSAVLLGAEFGTGAIAPCEPADASCAQPGPGDGYVIVHTSAGDLVVTLEVDAAGRVTASDPGPLPSIAPASSPSAVAQPSPGLTVAPLRETSGVDGLLADAAVVRRYYMEHRYQQHQYAGMYLDHSTPRRLVVMVTDDPVARPYPWEAQLSNPDRVRFRIADFPERRLMRTYRHLNRSHDAPWLEGSTGWGVATKRNRVVVYFLSGKAPRGFDDHVDRDVIIIRKKGYDQPTG